MARLLKPEDGAEPLVFLHGGPGYNSYSFRALFGDRLEAMGRPVVYLDQRGSGRSGPLEDTEQGADTLDLDTLVADLDALFIDRPLPGTLAQLCADNGTRVVVA